MVLHLPGNLANLKGLKISPIGTFVESHKITLMLVFTL